MRADLKTFSPSDRLLFLSALKVARNAHHGQKKFGAYPYIYHPVSVFNFLVNELGETDRDLLVAALLHDTVEDTSVRLLDIKKNFGARVASIIKTVTRVPIGKEDEEEKGSRKMDHFNRVVLKGSKQAKILGMVDKYDNLINAVNLPASSIHRKKFSRWIREAEEFRKLAWRTNKKMYFYLSSAIKKLKNEINGKKEKKARI